MAGGLLNLVAVGNQNVILNGNPQKTFFTSTYKKYTNFGLQKFRLDYDGLREPNLNVDSHYVFKVKRYAELLMDTYLVVNIPDIWSPIYPPSCDDPSGVWVPYEFRWIKDLGTQMIREITLTAGGTLLQKFTGEYLLAFLNRDFSKGRSNLYNAMSGNIPMLNQPENYDLRDGAYPNAVFTESSLGAEPSIRGKQLYVPLNFWFTLNPKQAFPLIAMQYNELEINLTLRPIRELFTIRDVLDSDNNYPIIAPNFNIPQQQFWHFLQTPPDPSGNPTLDSPDKTTNWNADVHLMATYCFLTDEESRIFAADEQKYLIKEMHETKFNNITGTQKVRLYSLGLVSNYMFLFQRNDVNLRNEWSNYTNWPYSNVPQGLDLADSSGAILCSTTSVGTLGPGLNVDGSPTGLYTTGNYELQNHKDILMNMGLLLDGEYRENVMPKGVYYYVEKYIRTPAHGLYPPGLYCYNFCLNTDPFDLQPNGAINMSKFSRIELEFTTFIPPVDPSAQFQLICDPTTDPPMPIGVVKPTWRLNDYNYDLRVYEERYNMVVFVGGNVGLMNAR